MVKEINWVDERNAAEHALDEAISAYNEAVKEKNLDAMREAIAACDKAKDDYNTASRMDFYSRCFKSENPLFEACRELTYQTIKHSDKNGNREKAYVQSVVNLAQLNHYANENLATFIGADPKWLPMIAKFTQLMTFYFCKEVGYSDARMKDVMDTYAIKEIAREIELGKTPTSKTQIQKQLQAVITAMIGEGDGEDKYNVLTHDAAYIMLVCGGKGREKLTIKPPTVKEMQNLIAQVAYRILTKGDYRVVYKMTK